MIMFFISAALLVALCLAWLLYGLFRSGHSSTDQEAVNITLARERRQVLDDALADGSIDQASHDYEREQLEYDLASDLKLESERKATRKTGNIAAAVVVAIFVPVAAGALYLQLGNPTAITQVDAPQPAANAQAPALADLLPQLEQRLATSPDDIEGWRLLGRSYLSVNEFARARSAFERALALDEDDVATLAQLSESIAMQQDGDLAGEPLSYLERANALDPDHEHTLWLLAIARQQAGDHEAALQGFDRLTAMSRDNPDALATIDQMRSRSLAALSANTDTQSPAVGADAPSETGTSGTSGTAGIADTAGTIDAPSTASTDDSTNGTTATNNEASIRVSVSLSEAALNAVSADSAVFIYARASEGPPMPLAARRVAVSDLPITITLDDSMAMIPGMTLSSYPSVTVGARVSASGNALAQSGDWFGEVSEILVADTDELTLTIEQQTP
ncbi:c-type cytochrome biogenesis protein CcmI [Granulosicoccus sp. 3-233]|uniref:c-type cytochrome biogenesis protein CcmI n=1 Tax=Granulosicoccus sp. 3-233 TaxID=3417969 RepID=UPI003D326562